MHHFSITLASVELIWQKNNNADAPQNYQRTNRRALNATLNNNNDVQYKLVLRTQHLCEETKKPTVYVAINQQTYTESLEGFRSV